MRVRFHCRLAHSSWIFIQNFEHIFLHEFEDKEEFSFSFKKLQQLKNLTKSTKETSQTWTIFSCRKLLKTLSSRIVVLLTSSFSSESLNCLIATTSFVSRFRAFQTMPYAPSPTVSSISYLSRRVLRHLNFSQKKIFLIKYRRSRHHVSPQLLVSRKFNVKTELFSFFQIVNNLRIYLYSRKNRSFFCFSF